MGASILVVMDVALAAIRAHYNTSFTPVSILVVMDVALAVNTKEAMPTKSTVSILVVMDVALAVLAYQMNSGLPIGLNPCCNGCCSRSEAD